MNIFHGIYTKQTWKNHLDGCNYLKTGKRNKRHTGKGGENFGRQSFGISTVHIIEHMCKFVNEEFEVHTIIPSSVDNLIIQEYKQVLMFRRHRSVSNLILEPFYIFRTLELFYSIPDCIIEWLCHPK